MFVDDFFMKFGRVGLNRSGMNLCIQTFKIQMHYAKNYP